MKSTWQKALGVGILASLCVLAARAQDAAKPSAAATTPAKTQAAAAMPTADQVLDHYVQAIGGRAAWLKLNSRVSKGPLKFRR